MLATRVGSVMLSMSKQVSMGAPVWCSIVPIAPSASSDPCRKRSRNGGNDAIGSLELTITMLQDNLLEWQHTRRTARIVERPACHRDKFPVIARRVQCQLKIAPRRIVTDRRVRRGALTRSPR